MNRKTVILGLFADRIDMLVCIRDRIAASRRIAIDFGENAAAWHKAMAAAVKPLRNAVEDLDVGETPAIVLYRSPTSCADYSSLDVSSASQARQAAILGCAESLTCTLDEATSAALVIGKDSSGDTPQTHVVVAADHDDALAAIASLVKDAGLQFEHASPIEAPIMARLASGALQSKQSHQGYLYVGEHRSHFLIAHKGNLLFARTISLGSESLILSLTKPLRAANSAAGAAPVELNIDEARELLHRFGFPNRDQIIHDEHGLTGAQIIPLLQPVLQRFVVELRQSLRFGVVEEQRQSVQLHVAGPGSAIPRFANVISAELGLEVETDVRYSEFNCHNPDSPGSELQDAIEDDRRLERLGLQPQRIAKSRQVNRLRRWLLTGAAASLAMTAMDAFHYHSRLADVREQVAVIESHATDVEALKTTGEKLLASIEAMEHLEAVIAREMNSTVDVRACLQEISRLTPETIRLASIVFAQEKERTVGRISGHAFDSSSAAGRTQLEPFVDRLKTCPLFDDVVLSNVQAAMSSGVRSQQFEINLTGIGVPLERRLTAAASRMSAASPDHGDTMP